MALEQILQNPRYNAELLVSDARHFDVKSVINPFMHEGTHVDHGAAQAEHDTITGNMQQAHATVHRIGSPELSQDGIYTANWALCLNGIALMANLPYARRGEVEHAAEFYEAQGFEVNWAARDAGIMFSGQGGALRVPGTDLVFVENGYRTDPRMNKIIEDTFNVRTIGLTAIPQRTFLGKKNLRIGKPYSVVEDNGVELPQSPGYDIDLIVGILAVKRIAYAPALLTADSRKTMRQLEKTGELDIVRVGRNEALHSYACNLVSVEGEDGIWRVIVNQGAKRLIKTIDSYPDMQAVPTANDVIKAGGGGFRCISNILNDRTPAFTALEKA